MSKIIWTHNSQYFASTDSRYTRKLTFHCKGAIIHLAKLIPRRFSKPAVGKYPKTVIKSGIYISLSKSYSLMWHLVRGNLVRNGCNRRPQTRRMRSPKVALLKISMDNTMQSTVESMITRMMSTAFRLGVAETACRVRVLCADSMTTCMSAW